MDQSIRIPIISPEIEKKGAVREENPLSSAERSGVVAPRAPKGLSPDRPSALGKEKTSSLAPAP